MSAFPRTMSALPPKADMCSAQAYVRFVPKADTGGEARQAYLGAATNTPLTSSFPHMAHWKV